MGISCGHQLGKADSAWNADVPKDRNSADFKDFWERFGWGTWIRTRTNGVRVRGSTVNLFPNVADRRSAAGAEFIERARI